MTFQVDSSSASQTQFAISSTLQQRQDIVRDAAKNDDDKDKTKTKPAHTAAAQSQPTDAKHTRRKDAFKTADNSHTPPQQSTGQRGDLVDLSV